jgi:hypothetical protein
MDERRVRPRLLRHGRRLSDGSVVVTTQDDDGRVIHAIRYDESIKHVLEELEGDEAEAVFGKGKARRTSRTRNPMLRRGFERI